MAVDLGGLMAEEGKVDQWVAHQPQYIADVEDIIQVNVGTRYWVHATIVVSMAILLEIVRQREAEKDLRWQFKAVSERICSTLQTPHTHVPIIGHNINNKIFL